MPKSAKHPKRHEKKIPKGLDNRGKERERDRGEQKVCKKKGGKRHG
jgi:hypothetical protein